MPSIKKVKTFYEGEKKTRNVRPPLINYALIMLYFQGLVIASHKLAKFQSRDYHVKYIKYGPFFQFYSFGQCGYQTVFNKRPRKPNFCGTDKSTCQAEVL